MNVKSFKDMVDASMKTGIPKEEIAEAFGFPHPIIQHAREKDNFKLMKEAYVTLSRSTSKKSRDQKKHAYNTMVSHAIKKDSIDMLKEIFSIVIEDEQDKQAIIFTIEDWCKRKLKEAIHNNDKDLMYLVYENSFPDSEERKIAIKAIVSSTA